MQIKKIDSKSVVIREMDIKQKSLVLILPEEQK